MRVPAVLCALLLTASPVAAAGKNITLYLDGARVESEAVAAKGYLEVPLPAGMEAGRSASGRFRAHRFPGWRLSLPGLRGSRKRSLPS